MTDISKFVKDDSTPLQKIKKEGEISLIEMPATLIQVDEKEENHPPYLEFASAENFDYDAGHMA
jgi:hypothetical protein